ncbi:MAG: hypothetical protein AB1813_12180 [Verrucomicrobiota bacterium]|jgi:hypothetical protein
MKSIRIILALLVLIPALLPALGMISVGHLSKAEAEKLGITMKHRKNGDAGVMVWLEFKKEGFLEKFSYAEFQMHDGKGKHVVSAMLQPRPVVHAQPKDIVSVAFSADPAHLPHCAFMIVAYRSIRGDVGYVLNVKDFFDVKQLAE